jgi:hypothetical protein
MIDVELKEICMSDQNQPLVKTDYRLFISIKKRVAYDSCFNFYTEKDFSALLLTSEKSIKYFFSTNLGIDEDKIYFVDKELL